MATDLKAALRRRREKTVIVREVPAQDGQQARTLKVLYLRPPESEIGEMLTTDDQGKAAWSVSLDQLKKYVTGWEGFTEADLLGSSVGAADVLVPFETELWAEVVGDDNAMRGKVANALIDTVVAYLEEKSKTTGN